MRHGLLLALSSLAVVAAACSSTGEPAMPSIAQDQGSTQPPPRDAEDEDAADSGAADHAAPGDLAGDAMAADASADAAGGDAGPAAFTKAEVQALFDARCAPCHIDFASAGMQLAPDFTASTVGVASTELPAMKRIAPGDKEASYLFHKVRGTHLAAGGSGLRMPRNLPPLDDEDIERLGKFIDAL